MTMCILGEMRNVTDVVNRETGVRIFQYTCTAIKAAEGRRRYDLVEGRNYYAVQVELPEHPNRKSAQMKYCRSVQERNRYVAKRLGKWSEIKERLNSVKAFPSSSPAHRIHKATAGAPSGSHAA